MGADHRADLGDEDGVGAEDLAGLGSESLSVLGILDVLDDPAVEARFVELARVLDEPFEDAAAGADALDRRDLFLQGQDRLDLQSRS